MTIGNRTMKQHRPGPIDRPGIATDAHLAYLDRLRKSGQTNMYGAGRYLDAKFPGLAGPRPHSSGSHSSANARLILRYWLYRQDNN